MAWVRNDSWDVQRTKQLDAIKRENDVARKCMEMATARTQVAVARFVFEQSGGKATHVHVGPDVYALLLADARCAQMDADCATLTYYGMEVVRTETAGEVYCTERATEPELVGARVRPLRGVKL